MEDMSNPTPKAKKPKVLRRKGKEVEEALLFEDQIDEAALAEWERRAGLKDEEVGSSPNQKPTSSQVPSAGPTIVEGPREVRSAAAAAPPKPAPKEPDWRQAGRLRWLGIAGARAYWEQSTKQARAMLLGSGLAVLWGLTGIGLFLGGLLLNPAPEPPAKAALVGNNEAVLQMIIPLSEGRAGLVLGLSLELGDDHVQTWMLREAVYDLISPMDPRELRGAMGMERVRRVVEDGFRARWPGIRLGRIRFLDYLIL